MALKATICKAALRIANVDSNYYQDHALTLARHPSETDERMMLRILAFALHADESLQFGRGISTDDEPDLWQKDLTGVIEIWIDVGQPDEKLIRKACGRSRQVFIYSYGGYESGKWWQRVAPKLERCENLTVQHVAPATCAALTSLAARSMEIQCTIQDGQAWMASDDVSFAVELATLKTATSAAARR
jgi:uncharacterized protein YaeQ